MAGTRIVPTRLRTAFSVLAGHGVCLRVIASVSPCAASAPRKRGSHEGEMQGVSVLLAETMPA
jgi:hypothetical protein